jgi:ATP-dependent DNA ligase
MEAELTRSLPTGGTWLYEPKWDGFRCLVFKDGSEVELRSKSGKPLGRYFPDLVERLAGLGGRRYVLDGEIVIPRDGSFVFDELLLRIHPAESRVRSLAAKHPAHFIAFDLLLTTRGTDVRPRALESRRESLEKLYAQRFGTDPHVHLSPITHRIATARKWLRELRHGMDGVMAKRSDLPYLGGERTGMRKIKLMRSADCVVGGFRRSRDGTSIGSLLLGLHDDDGLLHHVGFCSAMSGDVREEAEARLSGLEGGAGFSGSSPKGASRWRTEGSADWTSVEPRVVLEVEFDHFSGDRFRHGTRFLRWRPDKAPEACRLEQVRREAGSAMRML